jgi:hypothetical protein
VHLPFWRQISIFNGDFDQKMDLSSNCFLKNEPYNFVQLCLIKSPAQPKGPAPAERKRKKVSK